MSGLSRGRLGLLLLASAACLAALFWALLRPQTPPIDRADEPLVRRAAADRARAYKSAPLPKAVAWRVFRSGGDKCVEFRTDPRSRTLAYLACYDMATGTLVEERIAGSF